MPVITIDKLPCNISVMTCNISAVGPNEHSNVTNSSSSDPSTVADTSNDPLLYIVTVLMFYALSMTILMVKYIRREKQEAEFSSYYYEYVSRDKFHTAQYQNSQSIKHVMKSLSERDKLPKLKESDFADDQERLLPNKENQTLNDANLNSADLNI